MTKKVIAIISVLKPVDDTRNYEKVARSISNTNKYDINIIGFSTKKIPSHPDITFHPVFNFKRHSIKRLGASLKIFKTLLKLKPELIIVNTSELLLVSISNKILFGTKIIYDVQENYYRNIAYTNAYPSLIRYPIALGVRTIEFVARLFIDHFILAEKVYRRQMKFISSKSVIIENKALIPDTIQNLRPSKSNHLVFVYSGTIAEHYGIFDAIEFVKTLNASISTIRLVIIGYAARKKTYRRLLRSIENSDYIRILGGDRLVPHDQVLMQMKKADFCLLPYQTNRSTEGRIPTKLFECLAMETPVIITPNPAWDPMILENNAGIIHDFKSTDPLFPDKLHGKFYGNDLSSSHMWKSSSNKLIDAIQKTL